MQLIKQRDTAESELKSKSEKLESLLKEVELRKTLSFIHSTSSEIEEGTKIDALLKIFLVVQSIVIAIWALAPGTPDFFWYGIMVNWYVTYRICANGLAKNSRWITD